MNNSAPVMSVHGVGAQEPVLMTKIGSDTLVMSDQKLAMLVGVMMASGVLNGLDEFVDEISTAGGVRRLSQERSKLN